VTALLQVSGIEVAYGGVVAVRGLSLSIDAGELIAVLGSNGAGKSSTLRAISGLVQPRSGSIRFDGQELIGMRPEAIARLGIAHVPEGRGVFPGLSVLENLRLAHFGADSTRRAHLGESTEEVFGYFPILREKARQAAGNLSGGQQQQLVIARALVQKPRLLILDEPSLGLAPAVVKEVLDVVAGLRTQGMAVILVDQFVREALRIADRAAVMEQGRVVLQGSIDELSASRIASAYLGGEGQAVEVPAVAAGRGTEKLLATLPGSRVRQLEREAAAKGVAVDDVIGLALDRYLKVRSR
jgi:branched-chain amino acid transport system ATP-binding protein